MVFHRSSFVALVEPLRNLQSTIYNLQSKRDDGMQLERHITALQSNAEAITGMLRAVTVEQARWKPTADAWSILEVVNHLADEERDDFRLRLNLTLHQPQQPLPPIDPEGWVTARAYHQRELAPSLENFLSERQHSLAWLRTLRNPDWQQPCNHPHLQGLRAGDLLVSWVAHDLLHLRQLSELHWRYLAQGVAPFGVGYAGEW
ncbi:MAG: DinB family protein [Chloroflexaceae bacterium]|jgi:hypothetical protein|nr:DinB family protein [Chloroflexaceae bacterium]